MAAMACFRKRSSVIFFHDCYDPETKLSRHTQRLLSQFTHQPDPLAFTFEKGVSINIRGKISSMDSTLTIDDTLGDDWCFSDLKENTTRIVEIHQYDEQFLSENNGMSNYTWSIKISNRNTSELRLQQFYTSTNVFVANENNFDQCILIHNSLLTTTFP